MDQFNKLVLNLYGAAHDCCVAEFDSSALELTKKVVGFESATVATATFSHDESPKIQSIHIHNQPVEKLLERKNFTNQDTTLIKAYRNKGSCIIAEATVDNKNKPDLLQYCKKYDVAHTLVLIDEGVSKSHLDVIALWRARPNDAYTETDAKVGKLIIPHLFKARAINRKIHIRSESSQEDRFGLLTDKAGCLQFLDEPTVRVLKNEWARWEPPVLPHFFMESLRSSNSLQHIGKTFVAKCSIHDRYLFIQITPRIDKKNLTKAETAVASLAARGMSYKEIARELGTSPATVRNQLHSAYSKLGVSNKTSLALTLASPHQILPNKNA